MQGDRIGGDRQGGFLPFAWQSDVSSRAALMDPHLFPSVVRIA